MFWGVSDVTTFGYMTISALLLVPIAFFMMGGFPGGAPWQAPTLTLGTQLLNAVGALFFVMALSRGKASIVAPTTLAIVGSTLMVYGDAKRGEVSGEEQAVIANEASGSSGRSEANRPTV